MSKHSKVVAAYIRTSTHKQDGAQQIAELEAALARDGLKYKLFTDLGKSGREGNVRPDFEALKVGIRRGQITLVYFWDLTRLGRSLQDNLEFFKLCLDYGVGLKGIATNIDLTTPAGKAMAQMLSVFAEYQREMIRMAIKSKIAQKRAMDPPLPVGRHPKITEDIRRCVRDLKEKNPAWTLRQMTEEFNTKWASTYSKPGKQLQLSKSAVHLILNPKKKEGAA